MVVVELIEGERGRRRRNRKRQGQRQRQPERPKQKTLIDRVGLANLWPSTLHRQAISAEIAIWQAAYEEQPPP